ncbi:transcription factor bHLH160 isoform X2 [Eutrema salsugineum]|nr:transcription factor bHLH160 isoform X2 [Eutrema salsugineum]
MRLHASYLTLGTLLPDLPSSSKKKWCAPSIMDRVVTYIPKLRNEVEEITLRKQNLVEKMETKRSSWESERQVPHIRAISVLELVGSGHEAVVQISMKKEKEDEFSNLLHVIEVQGFSILSASTSQVCQHQRVVCYNFHCKMDEKPCEGDDYITVLKKNIIASLS